MENVNYYSSLLYGVNNDCEVKPEYDRTIDSVNGTIGIKHCYDTEYGAYNDVYLDDKYVCEADMECTDEEIEDLVEEALFNVDVNSDYPF